MKAVPPQKKMSWFHITEPIQPKAHIKENESLHYAYSCATDKNIYPTLNFCSGQCVITRQAWKKHDLHFMKGF